MTSDFCCVFPFFSMDIGGPAKTRILAFFGGGGFLGFPPKKVELSPKELFVQGMLYVASCRLYEALVSAGLAGVLP